MNKRSYLFEEMEADAPATAAPPELSIVMPCLNEAETLAACIRKAQRALEQHNIGGEIIIADNGSSDGSAQIARELGARVLHIKDRGYGSALMGGIAAARGRFILMADADDSYDLGELPRFIDKIREGYDLVQGCRLPSGGGTIRPGAMPLTHRYGGNPALSAIARSWFGVGVTDIYCGMRAFTADLYKRLDLRCPGMEFATEMIIKAARHGVRIAEVPITLHPDGRRAHPPHLRTIRDGWRTLRFFLMFSPRWMFVRPGQLLILLGLIGYALALPGLRIHGIHFSSHTLIIATLMLLCGYQSILFAVGVKTFAISHGIVPPDPKLDWLFQKITLERGIIAGLGMLMTGIVLLACAINLWRTRHFGDLDYEATMRWVVPGAALVALGFQTILSGFFLGILNFFRR
jgi:glycosyltransferase involved in cell wall biosynthesis